MRPAAFVRRFLLSLGILGAVLVGGSLALIKHDDPGLSDIRHHDLGYNTLAYQRFALKGCDNDVVMVGDSALLMGIMPTLVEKRVHAKVVNLGLYASSSLESFTTLLDHYLACNRKPKYVVFYFAASTPFGFGTPSYERSYTLVKYGSVRQALARPELEAAACVRTAWTILEGRCRTLFHQSEARALFERDLRCMYASKGFVCNVERTPLADNAEVDTRQPVPLDLRFMDELKRRYQAQGIRVLFCVAPMPAAERGQRWYAEHYGKIDNTITTLPNRYFADSRHLTAEGALRNSEEFAQYLKRQFAKDGESAGGATCGIPPQTKASGKRD